MSILRSWLSLFLACLLLCWAAPTLAQSSSTKMGESPLSVVGLSRVNVARTAERTLVVAGSAQPSWFESFDDDLGTTTRLQGILAAAYSPLPQLTVGANLTGRIDFSSGARAFGQPMFLARYVHEFSELISAGLQGQLLLEAGKAPSVFGVSPQISGLVSLSPHRLTTLALELGYFLDRSGGNLTPADVTQLRILVGASSAPSIPWGFGVSQRLGNRGTELMIETSGRILVGRQAPRFMESPWLVSIGGRHPLSPDWSISAGIEAALSARPDVPPLESDDPDRMQPYPPRLGGSLSVIYRPVFKKRIQGSIAIHGNLARAAPAPTLEPAAPPSSDIKGRIVDEGGRPVSDVEVKLTLSDGSNVQERTYADGTFVFPGIQNADQTTLSVRTPGFDKVEVVIAPGPSRFQEVVLYPAMPAGQVRGEVKTLKGEPISAEITVDPTKQVIQTAQDGSFDFELAPGRYTIAFEHEDYSAQRRVIVVEDHGVVILNIALTP